MDRKYTYAREKKLGCQSTVWTTCVFLKTAQNWQQGFTQHTREKIRAAQERKDQTKDKETRLVPPQL